MLCIKCQKEFTQRGKEQTCLSCMGDRWVPKEGWKKIATHIPEDLKKKIKIQSAIQGKSMQAFIVEALEVYSQGLSI